FYVFSSQDALTLRSLSTGTVLQTRSFSFKIAIAGHYRNSTFHLFYTTRNGPTSTNGYVYELSSIAGTPKLVAQVPHQSLRSKEPFFGGVDIFSDPEEGVVFALNDNTLWRASEDNDNQ